MNAQLMNLINLHKFKEINNSNKSKKIKVNVIN